jgi:hypothetical protein
LHRFRLQDLVVNIDVLIVRPRRLHSGGQEKRHCQQSDQSHSSRHANEPANELANHSAKANCCSPAGVLAFFAVIMRAYEDRRPP